MKIAIAIFGIPRGSGIAGPSIDAHIVRPCRAVGQVKLFGHLFRQESVVNPRSGENGSLSEVDYERFAEFEPAMEPPNDCLESIRFQDWCSLGDIYGDEFQSLRNLAHQLHSLDRVTASMERYAPDVVVFARPDLLYRQPLLRHELRAAADHPGRVYLPQWQWWNGYNDRLAVCGKSSYRAYGTRIHRVGDFLRQTQRPLHAERLLRYALQRDRVVVRVLRQQAQRVRINDVLRDENFDATATLGTSGRRLLLELRRAQLLSMLRL